MWFCEAGSGVVFSSLIIFERSILWVHTETRDKACVAHCRHVGPFGDIPVSGPSLSAFFARTARGRRSWFLAFASGIVRVVVRVIVVQLAAYGVNLHL